MSPFQRVQSSLVLLAFSSVTLGQDVIPPSPVPLSDVAKPLPAAGAKAAADSSPTADSTVPDPPVGANPRADLVRRPNDPQLDIRTVELAGTGKIGNDVEPCHVFDGPASFDWMGFDSDGNPIPRDRLTIYEGMTVSVYENGRYRIQFYAETPITVITLRLQLRVFSSPKSGALAGSKKLAGTITLPPIRFAPVASNGEASKTYSVDYAGYSEVLKKMNPEENFEFCRHGTARFGSGTN